MALMNGDSTDSIDNANFYYFDQTTGVVFFYVDQYLPTVRTDKTMKISGFTPEGTCDINGNDIDRKDVAKPGADEACTQAEELYTCPAAGCPYYVVTVRDPNYATTSPEVPSICDLAYSADKSTTAWQPYPETTDRLLRSGAMGGNNELCPITTTRAAK